MLLCAYYLLVLTIWSPGNCLRLWRDCGPGRPGMLVYLGNRLAGRTVDKKGLGDRVPGDGEVKSRGGDGEAKRRWTGKRCFAEE